MTIGWLYTVWLARNYALKVDPQERARFLNAIRPHKIKPDHINSMDVGSMEDSEAWMYFRLGQVLGERNREQDET